MDNNGFGSFKFEGKTYTLTEHASFSGRIIPGGANFHSAKEGETYEAEWTARGVDAEGNEVKVQWIHEDVKGAEREDAGEYDWTDIRSVNLV